MSTEVFGFTVSGPDLDEREVFEGALQTGEDGPDAARLFTPDGRFVSEGGVLFFPNASAYTAKDLHDFWTARQGFFDTFLYESQRPYLREIVDEAAGTHPGGAGVDFFLDRKFVVASSLVVKVAGVAQVITTDYTFSGNYTAPKITSTANMDAGAVTFSYRYYRQGRFTLDPFAGSRMLVPGASLASPGSDRFPFAFREDTPGGSIA